MSKTGTFLYILFSLALLPGLSAAQELDTPGQALTWEDCVTIAARSNPDLFSAKRAVDATRAGYYGSFNSFLPKLSLTDSYNDSRNFGGSGGQSTVFDDVNDTTSQSEDFHWEFEGSVSANLFNMANLATMKTALSAQTQAQANLRQVSADLRFNLRQSFAQLLFAQENIDVSRRIREIRERDSQLVTLRYDSGRESKGNTMKANAQFLQANADVAQAERTLRTAQISLVRQLGLLRFALNTADGELSTDPLPPLPHNMQSLLDARPDVALQEGVVDGADAGLLQAASPILPTLSGTYTRSFTGPVGFPAENPNWSFIASLNFPLFAGGPTATYFATLQAKKNLEKAKLDLRKVRDQARLDLEIAWAAFANALDQVKVQTALLDAARQRNEEADIRYESGLLTYENWEIIVTERVNAERTALRARADAMIAEAAWEKALGNGLGENS